MARKKAQKTVGPTVQLETEPEYSKVQYLQERLAEFEMELENKGYLPLSGTDDWEISRTFVEKIVRLARMMFLKNPIVKRTVSVQSLYTFALGITCSAEHPTVQEVIDEFWDSPRNSTLFGNHIKRLHLDASLSTDGQIFFVFFKTPTTGHVTLRTIPFEQIAEIYTNPDDKCDPWFFHRRWVTTAADGKPVENNAMYPRVGLEFTEEAKPLKWRDVDIRWESPILHAQGPNSLFGSKWAVPEVFAQLDWAMAYKNFLEDWLTIIRSYSRVAMQMSGMSKTGAAASKAAMKATNAGDGQLASAGQMLFTSGGVELKAVKTAGATTSAEEGRPVKLMAAASAGLPETFFGDADVGNFATAETLDRPTELQMKSRQSMWRDIYNAIHMYVLMASAAAPSGILAMAGAFVESQPDPANPSLLIPTLRMPTNRDKLKGLVGAPVPSVVEVSFPDILERNVDERIRALVGAFTMNGRQLHNLIDDRRLLAEMILEALGWNSKRRKIVLDRIYPPNQPVAPIPEPSYTGGDGSGGDKDDDKTVGPTGKDKKKKEDTKK